MGETPDCVEGPPQDFEGLRTLLVSRRETMPKRLKQLAAFALAKPEEMAFGTVAEIAEHAGVQPSTLVRFAQTFGYGGFSQLQQIFRARLRERFPDYRERLRGAARRERMDLAGAALLDGFVGAGSACRSSACANPSAPWNSRAPSTLLAQARHDLPARRAPRVSGHGLSRLRLRQARHPRKPRSTTSRSSDRNSSPRRRKRDAVLAISFTPYAPITVELAAAAARRGVPVVAITDSAFSPLVYAADVWLEVAEADYGAFRSLSASFALAMTLAVGDGGKGAGR